MVRTDLVAFFDHIQHGALEERLTSLGVRPDLASEVRAFLKAVMGRAHGLPQGLDPSGVLASAYLFPIDQALISAGYGYVRYVDDIVLLASDRTAAKRGLRLLEAEARRLGLAVQSAKTELYVGLPAMSSAVDQDDEIAGVDYVVRGSRRSVGVEKTHKSWLSVSRRRSPSHRFLKYLLNRLVAARDPVGLRWCLAHLGEADHMASTVARYLSVFSGRRKVQEGLAAFLSSPANISEWEEMNLLRAMLSAKRVSRAVLDRARIVAADRNAGLEVRQYAIVLLGKLGNATDHDFVARQVLDHELIAGAALLALQGADGRMRGRAIAAVLDAYPALRRVSDRLRGRALPVWPVFHVA